MKVYTGTDLRNVALVGHLHAGKTQLTAALLHPAGAVNRITKVDEGTAPTDFDEEERARKLSIQSALAALEWNKHKINLIDTPGFHMFLHETKGALVAADSALVVLNGVDGVEAQTQQTWALCAERNMPRAIVVSKLDRERASFSGTVESAQKAFGRQAIPIQLPIGEERDLSGVIDLITMKAASCRPDGDGKGREISIPQYLAAEARAAHEALIEIIAEGNDELLEEFFREGTLPIPHLLDGLRQAFRERRLFPILAVSGLHNLGTAKLLDFLVEISPSPVERDNDYGQWENQPVLRKTLDSDPLSVYVFKTLTDPFAGRLSYFRVISGVLKTDAHLVNGVSDVEERFAALGVANGKTFTPITELHAGDLGVVSKLKETVTGHTLFDRAHPVLFPPVLLPEPSIAYAVEAKSRSDEDKIGTAMHKLMEEDLCLRFDRDPQTKEFLLHGNGHQHIEIALAKLRNRYHVNVNLRAPKVPYRETIRVAAAVQGRHKKQTGGHGQFGDCWVRFEPLPRGAGFQFANETHGGSVPWQFIPAIEKGIVEATTRGHLAGYPLVDFKAAVYDGSYHDVDSSELAFKQAARKAFRAAMEAAKPALLEPVMRVEIHAPIDYAGDLISDCNGRRGRVTSMETTEGTQIIRALVPMAEMLTYQNDLTARTEGRGSYSMEFDHYDFVPSPQADKIIAAARSAGAHHHADEEED